MEYYHLPGRAGDLRMPYKIRTKQVLLHLVCNGETRTGICNNLSILHRQYIALVKCPEVDLAQAADALLLHVNAIDGIYRCHG